MFNCKQPTSLIPNGESIIGLNFPVILAKLVSHVIRTKFIPNGEPINFQIVRPIPNGEFKPANMCFKECCEWILSDYFL